MYNPDLQVRTSLLHVQILTQRHQFLQGIIALVPGLIIGKIDLQQARHLYIQV